MDLRGSPRAFAGHCPGRLYFGLAHHGGRRPGLASPHQDTSAGAGLVSESASAGSFVCSSSLRRPWLHSSLYFVHAHNWVEGLSGRVGALESWLMPFFERVSQGVLSEGLEGSGHYVRARQTPTLLTFCPVKHFLHTHTSQVMHTQLPCPCLTCSSSSQGCMCGPESSSLTFMFFKYWLLLYT